MKHDDDLVKTIYANWEKERGDERRTHLGASVIGRECDREIWYGFRWAKTAIFDGRMLRLFDRGKREEKVVMLDLLCAGMKIDYSGDEQQGFTDLGGHFAGSVDAIGHLGKNRVVVEIKTASLKKWEELHKLGVQEAQPAYWCQMQVYIGELNLQKALFFSVCKNDDRIHAEWVDFDSAAFEDLRLRAKSIIYSSAPPERLSDNPADYRCKLCAMWPICHGGESMEKSCRTCAFSVPCENGGWACAKLKVQIDKAAQVAACEEWSKIEEMPF